MKKLKAILTPNPTRPLTRRILVFYLPPIFTLILLIGGIGYFTIYSYMNTAIERNVRVRSTVIARTLESFLNNRIRDILFLKQGKIDIQALKEFMQRQVLLDPELYREAAFISSSPATSLLLVAAEGAVRQIAPEDFTNVRPNPMLLPSSMQALDPEEVFFTTIMTADFPFAASDGMGNRKEFRIFRIITPYYVSGAPAGYLMLGIDARQLRNVLSQASTSKGKAWGYDRSDEVRFSYLFDTEGWMLFQSEPPDNQDTKLSTSLARSGFIGTLGRPGLLSAFLPDNEYKIYWETVSNIHKNQGGVLRLNDRGGHQSPNVANYFMAFEPIRYRGKAGEDPRLFSGMIYIDRSKLAFEASKAALFMSLTWVCGGVLLLGVFLQMTKNIFINPLNGLKRQIHDRLRQGDCSPINLTGKCMELDEMTKVANELLQTIHSWESQKALLAEDPMSESMKQPLDLTADYQAALSMSHVCPEIIGNSAALVELKSQIVKAARTNVDIFILGETGTGKQLVAEAIHKHSSRRNGPFVAINCGALNENLLLDTLFGHVKGAHSEAKSDRKGAFIKASGGTLFLDEIQAASAEVQQSLLRAIAERKIRPLGSDSETEVDVRLVTATNEDLTQRIKNGSFREDLFYRLYVLPIQTLPLRNHKEDIPLIAYHYLKQTQEFVEKSNLTFSKGAVKRLLSHNWPGNIRELVNCITRTVVFAEEAIIQADDLRMEKPETSSDEQQPVISNELPSVAAGTSERGSVKEENTKCRSDGETLAPETPPQFSSVHKNEFTLADFSPRQMRALAVLLEHKTITRREYQQIIDEGLPARTANYDLNDLVQKDVLIRVGAGASTRYNLSPTADVQTLQRILKR